ncbi:UNVERIFIED_CONTAM: camp-dependent protein kinase catalytic subunit [Siphonaria sp. JEL0065]|nr:camp-dependent protein kinase catalytic subunit [Siphonaria sp. JEL0065]
MSSSKVSSSRNSPQVQRKHAEPSATQSSSSVESRFSSTSQRDSTIDSTRNSSVTNSSSMYRPLSMFSKKDKEKEKEKDKDKEPNLLRRLMASKTGTSATAPTSSSSQNTPKKPLTVKELAARTLQSMDRKEFMIADFTIKKTVGTGSFGRVHLVKLNATGTYFALKALRKSDVIKMHQVEHILNEKAILSVLDMPFLVGMLASFQDAGHLYFVLEYIQGGELFSYLRRSGRFENNVAKFYAAEVCAAFEYLHARYIVYRDLKPENLLIDSKGHIKITDFGFAKQIKDDQTWTLCGTPDYLAPEIIRAKGYGKSVDWWALGILIYEMIAGFPPFTDDDNIKLFEKITACKLRFPEGFDKKAKDLCKCLLTPDLSKRYGNLKRGAADVKNHVWFEAIDWDRLTRLEITAPYIPKVNGEGDTSNFESYDEDYPSPRLSPPPNTFCTNSLRIVMAATVQINPSSRSRRSRIPSDPLEENIYNLVLRPGIEDLPPPLYKSKFAHAVRSKHLKARRTMSNPASVSDTLHIAKSAIPVAGVNRKESKAVKERTGVNTKSKKVPTKDVTNITTPKAVSKPISKPTSGRIAMAAERRSNAATPVVADPCAWDHLAANPEANHHEHTHQPNSKTKKTYDEVPEELIEHWEPFSPDIDEDGRAICRNSSPPPTEMETGAVRKHGVKKQAATKSNNVVATSGSIGGGNRRRMLPEAERIVVLAGLKSNYQSLMGIYGRLSVSDDTISKRNRKTSIEKQLALLEDDIKKFSHPNIIIDEGN